MRTKNSIAKTIAFMCGMLLMIALLPGQKVNAASMTFESYLTSHGYYYQFLSENQKAAYDEIGRANITAATNIVAGAETVTSTFYREDHRAILGSKGLITEESLANGKTAISYANTLSQGVSGKDRYQKALFIHDLIAEQVLYNNKSVNKTTVYGALIEGEASCMGYSSAFQLLCSYYGIPCITKQSPTHMWNLVQLDDGEWYEIDVTWDDSVKPTIIHDYFCITSAKMAKLDDHKLNKGGSYYESLLPYIPVATGTKYAYDGKDKDDIENESSGVPMGESFKSGRYTYKVTSTNTVTLTKAANVQGSAVSVIVPDVVEYEGREYKVTEIGKKAFADAKGYYGITLPETIKVIGEKAFMNCKNLTTVDLTECYELTKIEKAAFKKCSKLSTFEIIAANKIVIGKGFLNKVKNNCKVNIYTTDDTMYRNTVTAIKSAGNTKLKFQQFG